MRRAAYTAREPSTDVGETVATAQGNDLLTVLGAANDVDTRP